MATAPRPRILVTGSAGYVGQLVLPSLRARYQLRCLDLEQQHPVDDDEIVTADINDLDRMVAACDGVFAIVHLAAKAFEDDFPTVLQPRNITGAWTMFQSAVQAGVRKVVFASTGQAVGGNEPGLRIDPDQPARPISEYACTKIFGEALGRFHSDTHGLQVACLRLGWVVTNDSPLFLTEPTLPGAWCSPDDLSRLIHAAITADVPYAVVLAVSPPATERFDTRNPYGWIPADQIQR